MNTYPHQPGFKARQTAREAAEAIAPKAGTLRERVLAAVLQQAGTPEQIAERLREPVMNIRPRCSELARLQKIRDSGARGEAVGGRKAIVWEAVTR